jgi:hypothetical protein
VDDRESDPLFINKIHVHRLMNYCLSNHVSQTLLDTEHYSEFIFYMINCTLNGENFESVVGLNQISRVQDLNGLFYLPKLRIVNYQLRFEVEFFDDFEDNSFCDINLIY